MTRDRMHQTSHRIQTEAAAGHTQAEEKLRPQKPLGNWARWSLTLVAVAADGGRRRLSTSIRRIRRSPRCCRLLRAGGEAAHGPKRRVPPAAAAAPRISSLRPSLRT